MKEQCTLMYYWLHFIDCTVYWSKNILVSFSFSIPEQWCMSTCASTESRMLLNRMLLSIWCWLYHVFNVVVIIICVNRPLGKYKKHITANYTNKMEVCIQNFYNKQSATTKKPTNTLHETLDDVGWLVLN